MTTSAIKFENLPQSTETVFVFRIGNLGDSLVALPAVQKIKKLNIKSKLVLITEQYPSEKVVNSWSIFSLTKIFDGVIFYEKKLGSIIRLIWLLRKKKNARLYYLAPDRGIKSLQRDKFFFKTICGIKKSHGFSTVVEAESKRDSEGNLSRQEQEYFQLLKSVTDSIPIEIPDRPYIHPSKEDFLKAKEFMGNCDKVPMSIALGPGSKMLAKQWPVERFSKFISRILISHPELYIFIFGASEDHIQSDFICANNQSERVISLVGKTTIGESAAALSLCSLYVGNDTGIMHLASTMGLPCVGIFASRANPGRWEPFGDENIIIRKELPCSGCDLQICLDQANKCLTDITVDEVFSATNLMIASLKNN